MRIALLTPTFSQFSGIDRVVEMDALEFAKRNDVTIFTFRAEIKLKNKNIKIEEIGLPKNQAIERIYRLFFFLDIFNIKKYVEKLRNFDLIISYFYPMNWLACYAKKKYGIKYVYWNAGIAYPHLFNSIAERAYMHLFKFFAKLSLRNADSAISISKFLQKELKKETNLDSKVKYIKIDRKRFHRGIDGKEIRKKYKLGKDPVCLYVGRISPHKGIYLLIKAFSLVLKEIPSAKLIIAGKPTFDSYSKELKRLSNDSVIFTGFVPDEELPAYYAACDVYTTASLWEGFDIPAVEAQACGKPVVAFNLCSHPEVVKKGILVKPNSIKEFSKAIMHLIKQTP